MSRQDKDDDIIDTFYIPQNYDNGGKLFSIFKTRNAVEAVIFTGILYYIEDIFLIRLSMNIRLIVMLFTLGPIAILFTIGIKGDSLSQFTRILFQYLKNKRKLRMKRIKIYEENK